MQSLQLENKVDAIAHFASKDILKNTGLDLIAQGNYAEAISHFERGLGLDPNDAKKWFNRDECLTEFDQDLEGALNFFEKATEFSPFDAEIWNAKGLVMQKMDRIFDAMMCFERSLEIAPGNSQAQNNLKSLFEKQRRRSGRFKVLHRMVGK